jgi:hypothetical protein
MGQGSKHQVSPADKLLGFNEGSRDLPQKIRIHVFDPLAFKTNRREDEMFDLPMGRKEPD